MELQWYEVAPTEQNEAKKYRARICKCLRRPGIDPEGRFRPPGWKSIPGRFKRIKNTDSVRTTVHYRARICKR